MDKTILKQISLLFLFVVSSLMIFNKIHTKDQSFEMLINKQEKFEDEKSSSFEGYNPENVFSKDTPFILIILFAFLYGILISLTPCIYPMIPITAAIVQTRATSAMWYNFLLSLTYVLGTALTYATLGLFVALTGNIFGQWLANPWFILFIILFFIYLAGSMFGWYEIYMPKFLTNKKDITSKGSFIYTFFAGMISGTVSSPCLTPALAAILLYVANQGNPFLGFITLFFFALGMGMILLIVGTSSAALNLLPTSGIWMIEVKRIFGFLLLGICIYFLAPLIEPNQTWLLIAGVTLTAALYYLISGIKYKSYIKIYLGALLIIIGLIFILEAKLTLQNKSVWTLVYKK